MPRILAGWEGRVRDLIGLGDRSKSHVFFRRLEDSAWSWFRRASGWNVGSDPVRDPIAPGGSFALPDWIRRPEAG